MTKTKTLSDLIDACKVYYVNDIIAQTMGKPTAGVAHQGAVESPIAAREEPIPEKQEIVESPEVKAKKLNRNKILAGLTPKFNDILKDAPDDPSIKAFAQGVIDVIKESKPIDWETVKDRLINIREKYPKARKLETDEYGNEKEPENEVIRERLRKQAESLSRKHEAEIAELRTQLAQQGASQQVQKAGASVMSGSGQHGPLTLLP